MRSLSWIRPVVLLVVVLWMGLSVGATQLAELQENQVVHGFKTLNLYENASGEVMGGRFLSERHGFLIDLLMIESVPQAFMYVKTPPTSSMGEPHACEHLLLGKGNRGRYVAAQEDMSLSRSSAFTSQVRTCYHFNTIAGPETFYEILEAKLQALLHPDFTDEEIRREVCHIGVTEDPETGELYLEEKGTVYTEMISSFEKPWYYYGGESNRLVYGDNHPLYNNSGGDPDYMRDMTAEDMWNFHKETHKLSNIGMIASIPSKISVDDFLVSCNELLGRCEKFEAKYEKVGISAIEYPPTQPAPEGTVSIRRYPSSNTEDPGFISIAYPAQLKMDNAEQTLMGLFLSAFSSGQTSNLHKLLFDSQTRVVDLGGGYVYGGADTDIDVSFYFGIGRIPSSYITETWLDSITSIVVNEMDRISSWEDGSEELLAFNERALGHLEQNQKQTLKYLNDPPMFGYRSGVGAGWMSLLMQLEKEPGFRKDLMSRKLEQFARVQLESGKNIWRDAIERWKLLSTKPYIVGAMPSPEYMQEMAQAKEERIVGYVEDFKEKYGADDAQTAIAAYKAEFDANTAELESLASKTKLPEFTDKPPMTLDPLLDYESMSVQDVPIVASTFENMTSSRLQLYFDLHVIPESLLVYVPLLPDLVSEVGVIENGQVVAYDEMEQRMRREVLGVGTWYDNNSTSGRNEFVISGQGGNIAEMKNAVKWIKNILNSPYLSEDNLPRMIDVIDQAHAGFSSMTQAPEEYWVYDPTEAYRFQDDPLYLASHSQLTQAHMAHRLRWMFTDPGTVEGFTQTRNLMNQLKESGEGLDRDSLMALLSAAESADKAENALVGDLASKITGASDKPRKDFAKAAQMIKQALPGIPDANLADDFDYLCDQIVSDLGIKPGQAIEEMKHMMELLLHRDNARGVIVSNSADRQAAQADIEGLLATLKDAPSQKQQYSNNKSVLDRMYSRTGDVGDPTYAGYLTEGTRNGVVLFSAQLAQPYDTTEEAILDVLCGKIFAGGGPHSAFMNTWAAGLAYSNGIRLSQTSGRVNYYAERCPDVAQTVAFVVDLIKNAEDDPDLVDYCVAQIFLNSRSQGRYEDRGIQMANSIVDGLGPDVQEVYRRKLLEIAKKDNIYEILKERMEKVYGQVLIGYGPKSEEGKSANYFLIGPETQFESLEQYIERTEGQNSVYRLYPRDYWLTAGQE